MHSITTSTKNKRLVAGFVDSLLFVYLNNLIVILQLQKEGENIIFIIGFSMLISLIVYTCKDMVNGQSPGKRVVGISVRDYSNLTAKPSKGRLLLRSLFSLIILPIEVIAVIGNKENRSFGDRLFKTIVVEDGEIMSMKSKLIWGIGLLMLMIVVISLV